MKKNNKSGSARKTKIRVRRKLIRGDFARNQPHKTDGYYLLRGECDSCDCGNYMYLPSVTDGRSLVIFYNKKEAESFKQDYFSKWKKKLEVYPLQHVIEK